MQAVEATAEAKQLVCKPMLDAPEQSIVPIEGYVVILGQNLAVHGQENWAQITQHSTWDAAALHKMLRTFFTVTKAHSIPSLDESAWRHDKVAHLTLIRSECFQGVNCCLS